MSTAQIYLRALNWTQTVLMMCRNEEVQVLNFLMQEILKNVISMGTFLCEGPTVLVFY